MNVNNILSWIGSGLFIGFVARFLLPGSDARLGWIGTILAGIVGSFVGGYLGSLYRKGPANASFSPASFLMSVLGTIVVLLVLRFVL
jgi:uncharacterized membrane protein YeaQ/YmgE (transglycosylase-associated protein family)